MSDDLTINGNQHSWGSIIIRVNDERYHGFTSISYGDARERVKAYGMGRHHAPRGRSKGKYTTEPVTVTGWKDSVKALKDALAAAGDGESFGDTEVQIIVQYIEGDLDPITDEINRCVWVKTTSGNEEGPDPLKEDIEFDCMFIRWSGKTLFDNSQAGL